MLLLMCDVEVRQEVVNGDSLRHLAENVVVVGRWADLEPPRIPRGPENDRAAPDRKALATLNLDFLAIRGLFDI